jgi:hypothetical protein
MKQSSYRVLLFAVTAILFGSAAPARAQGFIAPFVGYNFGGDAKCPEITQCEDKAINGGIALGHMGPLFGFEEEFGYANDFFGNAPGFSSSVLTVMSSVMITPQLRPIRPYFLVGMGLIKTDVELNATSLLSNSHNSWGWDIGGGVMIGSKHVAVRGDIRFFHSFQDVEVPSLGITLPDTKLDFGRASAGLVIGF